MKKLYLLIILLFMACSSPQPPKWYNKVYNDNENTIYSTGLGNTKKEAITNALANASSKILIVVKSNFNSINHQYKNNNYSSYANDSILKIQTKTNPITFSNYKILKLQKKDKYYVLIKINRQKNAEFMCNNIEKINLNINNLNIFLHYKKIISSLNKEIQQLQNINAIYPICKNKLNNLIKLKNLINKKYNNLSVSIYSNDNNLLNILNNILNIKNSYNGKIKIYINQKTKYTQIGDNKIATIYINLKIKNNHILKRYSLTCAASSIEDFHLAKELAYKNCKDKLKNILEN